jgi:hypothetical protein
MTTSIANRGRPRGERRQAFTSWAEQVGRFTMAELASAMAWPVPLANSTLSRARDLREVREVGMVRTTNAKRPVTVYELTGRVQSPDLVGVMHGWLR